MTYASLMRLRANPRSYITEPALAPPASPHALDQEFNVANGTTAATLGWTAVNAGTTVAAIRGGRMVVTPQASVGFSSRIYVLTPPATPYTLSTRMVHNARRFDFIAAGLMFRNAASGRQENIGWESANTGISVQRANTATGGSITNLAQQAGYLPPSSALYLQVEDDGTNIYFRFSQNGLGGWIPFYQEARTAHVNTPDQVGFYVMQESNNAGITYVSFDFMRFNWTPDFDAYADR